MPPVIGGTHDILTRKAGIIIAAEIENPLMALVGEGQDYAFNLSKKTSATRGSVERTMFTRPLWDTVTRPYGAPVIGQEDRGTEEYDEVRIDYHVMTGGVTNTTVDQMVVNWNVEDKEIDRLGSQWAYQFQKWQAAQATGQTTLTASDPGNQSHYPLSGSNNITAMDSAHTIIAPKSDDTIPANENSLDSTCTLTTSVITECIATGSSRGSVENPMAPCETPWGKKYVLGVSTQGLKQLRSDDPRNQFVPLTQATLSGGFEYLESAAARWTGFIYDDTVVIRVPALDDPTYKFRGINGSSLVANTGVAFFLGANAVQMVLGEGLDETWLDYSEFRAHKYLSIETSTVCGMKRTVPSGWAQSWGAIRVVHYSKVA